MRSIAILALAAALPAQAAFSPFGFGCTFQGQTLAIGNTGLPRLGTTFTIDYSGPNYTGSPAQQRAQPYLAFGIQPQTTVIPAGLLLYQPAGCTGFVASIAVQPMPPHASLPQYLSSYAMAIPNDPGLSGVAFFVQWVTLHSQCGFSGCSYSAALTSDAAAVTIGP